MIVKFAKRRESPRDWLKGTWECRDLDAPMLYCVRPTPNKIEILTLDKISFDIRKATRVVWNGQSLRFELYWPETKYRTRHVFTPINASEMRHECTCRNAWTKDTDASQQNANVSKGRRLTKISKLKTKLIGTWTADYSPLTYQINRSRGEKFDITVTSGWKGVFYRVSNQEWDDKALSFDVVGQRSGWRFRVRLIPISGRRLIMEETEWDTLENLGWNE